MRRFLLLVISCCCCLSSSSSWWWFGSAAVSATAFSGVKHDVVLLGVAPRDEEYYNVGLSENGKLKCKDGSNSFTSFHFNDDFCDCPDASDEPGTSACPNGKFYCKNAGHLPLSIYSSRVNDGICDCCDGSDEYDGKVKCPNTCWEAGKEARQKLKQKIATYQQGVTIRKRELEQAKLAIEKEEAELSKLKDEEKILKGLVQQLKECKEQIERAEEKERLQKEKEEREKVEAEEAKLKDDKTEYNADAPEAEPTKKDIDDKVDVLEDSPSSQDVVDDHENSLLEVEHSDVDGDEGPLGDAVEQLKKEGGVEHVKDDSQQHAAKKEEETLRDDKTDLDTGKEGKAETENTESLSREELGRRVASRWTGEKSEEETKDVGDAATFNDHEYLEDDREEVYSNYDSEDEEHKYDDVDDMEDETEDFGEEDHHDDSSPSYKYESDAEEDHDDASSPSYKYESDAEEESDLSGSSNPSWLEKIQKSVRRILQAVPFFQGPVDKSEAARVLKEYDESSDKLSKIRSRISRLTKKLKQDFGPEKQFYSFYGHCFESKQNKYVYKICAFKEASQTESYSTTRLGNWDKFEDNYRTMQFSNGDKCWNGPDRSLKVKLRCGLTNEVSDVDEPSRCEYLAFLSTPALCHEEKLKELQDKLDTMNKEVPREHDEL